LDKVFKVEITNGEPDGYRYATQMDLPARGAAYTQALRQAKVANFVKMETEVLQVYHGPVTAGMVEGAPLSDLNTLALELANLDDLQLAGLEGMLQIYREHHDSGPIPTEDLHRMIDHSGACMVAGNIRSDQELGRFLDDSEMIPDDVTGLLHLSKGYEELYSDLLTACAKQWRRESCGVFTSQGYVEPDMDLVPFLLGQEQEQQESPGMGMTP
jgi:hypothetical protein